MNDNEKIIEALSVIKDECKSHGDFCIDCPFHNDDIGSTNACGINNKVPEDWKINKPPKNWRALL